VLLIQNRLVGKFMSRRFHDETKTIKGLESMIHSKDDLRDARYGGREILNIVANEQRLTLV
jgi:hypothetical protein